MVDCYLLDDQGETVPYALNATPEQIDAYWRELVKCYAGDPRWFVVARSEFDDIDGQAIIVSTIFLRTDQRRRPKNPPQLFETMVFGGERDGQSTRYAARGEALAGHRRIVGELTADLIDTADDPIYEETPREIA